MPDAFVPGQQMKVDVRVAPGAEDLPLPEYKTAGSVGMDLYAAVQEPVTIAPGKRAVVPTGVHIAVPEGYEAQVRARSGAARDFGIGLVNAPGTIDSDFRGLLQVILINTGEEPYTIRRGDRIAQLVVAPVVRVVWNVVDSLDQTARGEGGFGHTGRH
jgi:dUTP pyrophosphatase